MPNKPKILLDGLMFPEGPRWHSGSLYFSDMHDGRVIRLGLDGQSETVVEVPGAPSGLGWLPDGRLQIVSMADRRLLRLDDDGLSEVADLGHLAPEQCNDMVVDGRGRAYIGNFGFDLHAGAQPCSTVLIKVEPTGEASVVAKDLGFPNGTVITPDGRTLIIAETFEKRLTAFDIADDGSLAKRREYARLEGLPDGICLDAEGAVWVATPFRHEAVRVREGGEVTDRIAIESEAFACMLGGPERRTLFLCTAETSEPEACRTQRSGAIEIVEVDVPGAGLP